MSDSEQVTKKKPKSAPTSKKRPPRPGPPGKAPKSGPPGGGPPGPPPKPALQRKAPGVKGRRQAPEVETLKTGEPVGNRFIVERYLGSSGGGVSYLCNDRKTQDPVVVKVLDMPYPGDEEFKKLRSEIGMATSIEHPCLSQAVGMGRTKSGDIFIAMEYVEGRTLSQLIAERRDEGRTLSLRDAFTVLAHTCDALEAVHKRRSCHGVLTPYNIYVNSRGRVKVGNLAIGRVVSRYLYEAKGEGAFVDSIYVAPEAAGDPRKVSARSDLYSLGMIAAELLSPTGLPGNRKEAHDMAVDALAKYPPSLFSLVSGCLSSDPAGRPRSTQVFRDEFEEIARDAGAQLTGPPPPGALPIEPAVVEEEGEAEDGLFDLFDLDDVKGPGGATGDDRYLVQKGGLDYGPFTEDEILEQLYQDEINEHSPVLDRVTQNRKELQEFEVFREKVLEYIPKREERLRLEAERRAEIQRKVKKGGKAALVVGNIGALIVLIGMGWFWLQQPDPEPMPLDQAFASLDYHFAPPPTDFQAMEVDSSVMESIFNPEATEEEIARQIAAAQSRARASRSSGSARPSRASARGSADEIHEVDMSADGATDHHLTDNEIMQVVAADFAALRSCIMTEVDANPSFRGVTVKFFIRPSGTTGGVSLKESQFENRPVGQCLIDRFRSMTFPQHGAVTPRGVEYPLYVQ